MLTLMPLSAFAVPGLDERPSNPTCVAPEEPEIPSVFLAERFFQALPLSHPIDMVQPPGDDSIWWLAERGGKLLEIANDAAASESRVVLDRSEEVGVAVSATSEHWGITSLAPHPDFESNGYLFIAYNGQESEESDVVSTVARFTRSVSGIFDPASVEIIFSMQHDPQKNLHHLGQIAFDTEGLLHIGLGDGRSSTTAQDGDDPRGSILRIDVDGDLPYTIPQDNPFVDDEEVLDEIYAMGFRNPWRFSFDSQTGDLWLGDVGAGAWEEVNLVKAGENYGWPLMEGARCWLVECDTTGLALPLFEYSHSGEGGGVAVIGGFVYEGSAVPGFEGLYVFGDFNNNQMLWGLTLDENPTRIDLGRMPIRPTSFARDLAGEIFVFFSFTGRVYKLVPETESTLEQLDGFGFPELLSETGCFASPGVDEPLTPIDALIPYTVNAPLWSDGADKQRWLGLPDGETLELEDDGDIHFPTGTVLIKTFEFDGIPHETRLFMRHPNGNWAGYSYEWNEDGSDAQLLEGVKLADVGEGAQWTYPGPSQCASCHTEAAGFTLGAEVAQLNGDHFYPATGRSANQLETWTAIGLFGEDPPADPELEPALAAYEDLEASLDDRARSYLHANCSGCHRPDEPSPVAIDLHYLTPFADTELCRVDGEPPMEDLVKPWEPSSNSPLSQRIHATSSIRMPPIGSQQVDPVGGALIDDWIAQITACVPEPASGLLQATALLVLLGLRRRRARASRAAAGTISSPRARAGRRRRSRARGERFVSLQENCLCLHHLPDGLLARRGVRLRGG